MVKVTLLPIGPMIRRAPGNCRRALRNLVYANPLYGLSLKGRVPARLRFAPPDPWPGDSAAGIAILGGEFPLAGRRLSLGEDPWSMAVADRDAASALHGFAWLGHLGALGSDRARERARGLVGDWKAAFGTWEAFAWRPDVLGQRLANWFAYGDFLCAGADQRFVAGFLASVAVQARHLGRVAASADRDAGAFLAIKGLIYRGISMPGGAAALALGLKLLSREMERQVLPDGGHFQRCPSLHLGVMRHLVDIRGALAAARVEVPADLQGAIDRMAPMLRAFRLGDGNLALFNGGHQEAEGEVDAVLAQAGAKGKPVSSAPHSGFQRLAAGRTTVIVDTGAPPSGERGHAGTLSFEMSVGKERLIVNCGHSSGDTGWNTALRSTAAHSTAIVEETNSAVVPAQGSIQGGAMEVAAARRMDGGNHWLETSHDGYRGRFGLVHHRNLYLASSGLDLRGEDRFSGPPGHEFAARFHLHPKVRASLVSDGSAVLLGLPGGGGWRFRADGGSIRLEDTVYMGVRGESRRSQQIVLSGPPTGDGSSLRWSLAREPKRR